MLMITNISYAKITEINGVEIPKGMTVEYDDLDNIYRVSSKVGKRYNNMTAMLVIQDTGIYSYIKGHHVVEFKTIYDTPPYINIYIDGVVKERINIDRSDHKFSQYGTGIYYDTVNLESITKEIANIIAVEDPKKITIRMYLDDTYLEYKIDNKFVKNLRDIVQLRDKMLEK